MSAEVGHSRGSMINGNAMSLTPPDAGAHILIASDCSAVGILEQDVVRQNYRAKVATTGREVLETFAAYDLILLDTDLPDLDGVSISRAIRQISDIPIIAFASADELDQVLLLEIGCDDCIQRPYRTRDLVARIKAVLRRTRAARHNGEPYAVVPPAAVLRPAIVAGPDVARHEEPPKVVTIGDRLVIKRSLREARLDGRLLELTRKEYDLLELLASEPGRIFDRSELMTTVWDYPPGKRINAQASRTIDTHVSSLRRKLGHRDWITNVRGVGFRLDVPVSRRVERDRIAHSRLAAAVGERMRPRLVKPLDANESA